MSNFKPLVGIDLGTTFSAMAYIDEHQKPVMIPNREGNLTTPSVVHFIDSGNFVVGDEASNMMISEPKTTVSFIKRYMGEPGYQIEIYENNYNPQNISALILKKMKEDAEQYLTSIGYEGEVKDVVITVPAYFGMEQKGATKEAGELAGFNVLNIMNEPTAAALAFGINTLGEDSTIFVFDLGGGTFDVTILELKGKKLNMVASDGNPELGGKDWDDYLLNHCANQFNEKHGSDPQDDLYAYSELYDRILKAKISLSQRPKTKVQVAHEGNRETYDISREDFEQITADLLSQCQSMSEIVLEKAGKTWADIDNVLLVGGSTYMPMVKELVKKMSGKEPSTQVNPDHCVAIGAAYQARLIDVDLKIGDIEEANGEAEAKKEKKRLLGALDGIEVTECVAHSLGVVLVNDEIYEMIPEQTKIPFSAQGEFGYAYDNQESVQVQITEGKGKTKAEVAVVGEVILGDLPPRLKGTPINVTFTYNKDKTLEVEVTDVETNKTQRGKVVLEGSMTDEEKKTSADRIARMTSQ